MTAGAQVRRHALAVLQVPAIDHVAARELLGFLLAVSKCAIGCDLLVKKASPVYRAPSSLKMLRFGYLVRYRAWCWLRHLRLRTAIGTNDAFGTGRGVAHL